MPDLSVDVNRNDIVVSKPSSGLSVTYRRTGRVLVALDSRGTDLPCSSVERLAQLIKTPRGGGVGNHLGAKILIRGVAAFLDVSGGHGNPQLFLIWNGLRTTLLGPFFCVISLHDRANDPPLSAAMELLEADLEALRKARANVRGSAKLR